MRSARMRQAARPRRVQQCAAAKNPCASYGPPSGVAQKNRRSSSTSPQRDGLRIPRFEDGRAPAASRILDGRSPKPDFSCPLPSGYSLNPRKLYADVSTTGLGDGDEIPCSQKRGAGGGAAWYDVTHHFTTPGAITPDVTTSDRDGIFGFHAGAQWQWGAWVLGVEAA